MDCESIRKGNIPEAYREGQLSLEEAEEYERHYFSCRRCFEDLLLRDRIAEQLKTEGATIFAREIAKERAARAGVADRAAARPRPLRDLRDWLSWLSHPVGRGGLVAAAAVAVLVIVTVQSLNRTAALKECWTPSAHPYIASELRGGAGTEAFRKGMELYSAGRYGEAAEWLGRSAEADPQDAVVHFYRGVALLLAGEAREAEAALETASSLTPSSDLYRWYLAQAQLKSGHAGKAEATLRSLAAGGEYAEQARGLLEKIAKVRSK